MWFNPTSMTQISITLPPPLKAELQRIADREHRSLAGQIRLFLERSVPVADTDPETAAPTEEADA